MAVTDPACYTAQVAIRSTIKRIELYDVPEPKIEFAPFSTIQAALRKIPVKDLFVCGCETCVVMSGYNVERRHAIYNYQFERDLLGGYAATYALLIYVGCPGLIQCFRSNQLVLRHEALNIDKVQKVLRGEVADGHISQARADDCCNRIQKSQYLFFAPLWEPCDTIRSIPQNEVLPLSEEKEERGNRGNFGIVRKCSIMEGYKGGLYAERQINHFARKVFKSEYTGAGAEEWKKLLEIKHTLRAPHDHIVETFGAYRHGEGSAERFFIAFPWADGTLAKYLAGSMSSFSSEHLWKQMSGIADGLAALHRQHDNATRQNRSGSANLAADERSEMVRFYHLDLKPANILVFGGVFKIADFGLARVRRAREESYTISTVNGGLQVNDYSPPDLPPLMLAQNKSASAALAGHDLWSLGAIYSEVAVFDALGNDAWKEYRNQRFLEYAKSTPDGKSGAYVFYKHDKTLMGSVEAQHQRIQNSPSSNGNQWMASFYSQDFFNIIIKLMDISPEARLRASEAEKAVTSLIDRAGRPKPTPIIIHDTRVPIPDPHSITWTDLKLNDPPSTMLKVFIPSVGHGEKPQKRLVGFYDNYKNKFMVLGVERMRYNDYIYWISDDYYCDPEISGVVPCYSHLHEEDDKYAIELCLTVSSCKKVRKFCMSTMSDCIFMQERILNQFCIGRYEVHSDYYKYASAHFISRSFDINKVIMRKVVGKDVVIEEDLGLVVQLWLNQNLDLKAGQSGQKYPAGRMLIWQKQKANNENSSIRSTKKSSRHCHVVKVVPEMETEKIESTDSATIVHVKMKSFSSSVELHKIGLVNDRGLPRIFPEPKDYDKYSKISLFFPKGSENDAENFRADFKKLRVAWSDNAKAYRARPT